MKTELSIDFSQAVVDASVAVKWFSEEIHTDIAERLLARAHRGSLKLYAPDLLITEVANALWKGKHFDEARITASLQILFDAPIELVAPDRELMVAAVSLMVSHNLTSYDALHVALASFLSIPLFTANPKDHDKVKAIRVVNIARLSSD